MEFSNSRMLPRHGLLTRTAIAGLGITLLVLRIRRARRVTNNGP